MTFDELTAYDNRRLELFGRHKATSVVFERFSLFDYTNLFVADASLFPAGCGVSPQMTTMALAQLAAERVVAD